MVEQRRTTLGTISIVLALVPWVTLGPLIAINPPCGTVLKNLLEGLVIYGTMAAFLFSVVAAIRDRPKKRAIIGLSISSLAGLALLALLIAIVLAVISQSSGAAYGEIEPGVFLASQTAYDITGSTGEELRAQMNHFGPRGYDAYAETSVHWNYRFKEQGNGCAIYAARVDASVTCTYPRWEPLPGAPQELKDKWNAFRALVEIHEKGHGDIAVQTGWEVYEALTGLPPSPSCGELKRTANARAQAIVDGLQTKHEEYDRVTEHGRAQGVQFP
jgi:predicted secreted Zn-dependent protease